MVRYIPHQFFWKKLDAEEMISIKKKDKETKVLTKDCDLRNAPFFIKDGDIIGVNWSNIGEPFSDEELIDNWDTEDCIKGREEIAKKPKQEEKPKETNKKSKKGGEHALVLNPFADDDSDIPIEKQD